MNILASKDAHLKLLPAFPVHQEWKDDLSPCIFHLVPWDVAYPIALYVHLFLASPTGTFKSQFCYTFLLSFSGAFKLCFFPQ